MTRQLWVGFCLALVTAGIPLRAANRPHAGTDRQSKVVWTNDDLDKLHNLGIISIIGREDDERSASAPPPAPYLRTQDPRGYAEQAARLRDELEYRQCHLHQYQKAIDEARTLREPTGRVV